MVSRIPFDELGRFPDLFKDYCSRYEKLADYFAGDYRVKDARRVAVERAAGRTLEREIVADVLLEQNSRWAIDDAVRDNIEALRSQDTAAVVTGQQVGIFTGPLYTLYKALSTVQLARQLTSETGRRVVPVFWLGGEDHDFDEVAGVLLLDRNDPVWIRYQRVQAGMNGNAGAVGRMVLGPGIEPVLAQLDELLPPSEFKPKLMALVREAYHPERTFTDAFALLLRSFFEREGLVLLSPDDARLKRIAQPLFRREVEQHSVVAEEISRKSADLGRVYHEQIQPRAANLFLLEEGGRYALEAENSEFLIKGTERRLAKDELLELVERAPERFSPNVVMRPIMQDILLPTAAYVGGPGEISYYAQLAPAYRWADLPMPLIYPRASVTIVESKVRKVLDKFDLSVSELIGDFEQLFQRVVMQRMSLDVEALFSAEVPQVHAAVNRLKTELERIEPTLGKAVEATRTSLIKEITRLKTKVIRAEKQNQDEVRSQLEKAHLNIYPDASLQERVLSPLYFMNKYGMDFVARLLGELSTDTTEHQIVDL